MHRIILASTGAELMPGRSRVRALTGPHTGQWFTLHEVHSHKGEHHVHVSRRTHAGRQHLHHCALSMFGLVVEEIVSLVRHVVNTLVHMRRKIDDGVILGALALIPLALFEAFHGGEWTRHLLEMLFNSRANGGGGEH